jgi:hypothetical protein
LIQVRTRGGSPGPSPQVSGGRTRRTAAQTDDDAPTCCVVFPTTYQQTLTWPYGPLTQPLIH